MTKSSKVIWFALIVLLGWGLYLPFKKEYRVVADYVLPALSQIIPIESYFLNSVSYKRKIHQYSQLIDRNKNYDIVLLGDSHIEFFDRNHNGLWLNLGISNDTTEGLIKRLGSSNGFSAKSVYLMIGYNDLRYRSPSKVILNFKKIISLLKKTGIDKVYVFSILPVQSQRKFINSNILSINIQLKQLSTIMSFEYLNIHGIFYQKGGMDLSLSYDGVHLNSAGYKRLYGYIQ